MVVVEVYVMVVVVVVNNTSHFVTYKNQFDLYIWYDLSFLMVRNDLVSYNSSSNSSIVVLFNLIYSPPQIMPLYIWTISIRLEWCFRLCRPTLPWKLWPHPLIGGSASWSVSNHAVLCVNCYVISTSSSLLSLLLLLFTYQNYYNVLLLLLLFIVLLFHI